MTRITYEIVEHDGGWAYKVGDVFSEPFRSRDAPRQLRARGVRPSHAANWRPIGTVEASGTDAQIGANGDRPTPRSSSAGR